MKNKSRILVTLALLLALGSCKTHQTTTAQRTVEHSVAAETERYNARIQTFSGRASLSLNSTTMGAKVTVKSIVDSALVISIQAFLGIEIGRIYCDRKELLLIDKYHNQYAVFNFDAHPGLPISLDAVQSLLLGRYFDPFGVGFDRYRTESDGQNRQLSYVQEPVKAEFLSNPQQQLIRSYFHTTDYKTYGMAEYRNFNPGTRFPETMNLKLASPKMIEAMTLGYSKAEVNGAVSVERPATAKYKKVNVDKFWEDLTKF
ncbi:MAG: DUF4292 domain-containing protein [Paludibacteraceae bacterium]|nr:DUF4292 domain-containing protein [Paludibacteraceae bacterium]